MTAITSLVSEDDLCGTAMLSLVSRGHVIINEILVLSKTVPSAFVSAEFHSVTTASADNKDYSSKDPARSKSYVWSLLIGRRNAQDDFPIDDNEDDKRFAQFLFDFRYLRDPEGCERSIELPPPSINQRHGGASLDLRALEADFILKHGDLIARFYKLFADIYVYQQDLNKFAVDLSSGLYIQHTIESILSDRYGKQILSEVIYLYGVMLILADKHMKGPIRERLIVAHLRFSGGARDPKMNGVVTLFSGGGTGVLGEEEKLFAKFPVNRDLVQKVIDCLVAEDLYVQAEAFPDFHHRSIGLSKQASLLYTILFFQPKILRQEFAYMQTIVNRFFRDTWMVTLHTGMVVDLSATWERYDAATTALSATKSLAKDLHSANLRLMTQCSSELHRFLSQGNFTDSFVLNSLGDILGCMRKCNVALWWRMLHQTSSLILSPADSVNASQNVMNIDVLQLLVRTAYFEQNVREALGRLLKARDAIWAKCRSDAVEVIVGVAKYLEAGPDGGNDDLIKWFDNLAMELKALYFGPEQSRSLSFARAQLCIEALEEIKQRDTIDGSAYLQTAVTKAQDLVLRMSRAVNLSQDIMRTVDVITDMSYAIEAIKAYTPAIHKRIDNDPSTVSLLHSLFLKFSRSLEVPLLRLLEWSGDTPQLDSVRRYQEKALSSFIGSVLNVIPASVFSLLLKIADARGGMTDLPNNTEISSLAEFSHSDQRYSLSMLTYELSLFFEGVTKMNVLSAGGMEIRPIDLVHVGIRKELVEHISASLHHGLRYHSPEPTLRSPKKTKNARLDFLTSMTETIVAVSGRLRSLRDALSFSQEYTGMAGSSTFDRELQRIIAFNVEQEANKYLQHKVHAANSKFQSEDVPIPRYAPTEQEPLYENFMGRTMSALLQLSEPQKTIYSLERSAWFLADGGTVLGRRTISLIRESMGVKGLIGIEKLLSFRILNELQRFVKSYRAVVKSHGVLLEQLRDGIFPEWKPPVEPEPYYENAIKKTSKLMNPIVICLRRVGQAQLLRRLIRNELQMGVEGEGRDRRGLRTAVNGLSMALVTSSSVGQEKAFLDTASGLAWENITDTFSSIGGGDPLSTMFLETDPLEGLPILLALFVIGHASELMYDEDFGALIRAKKEFAIDGWPCVYGMATLLRQFHSSYSESVISYIGQYARATVMENEPSSASAKKMEGGSIPPNVRNVTIFVAQLKDRV